MWTKKQSKKFQTPNYSKEYFRKPTILKLLGNIKNKKIIEFGCGSGYWTRVLTKRGATCTGVDSSKEQIEKAIENEKENPLGINYVLGDITNLKEIKSNQFDYVFIEFVLLEIPKRELLVKLFNEAFRVLKKDGKLFISDMHPFDPFYDKRYELPEGFNYYSSGGKFFATAKQTDGTKIRFADYHWTFEDYCGAITETGFLISELKEPRPSKSLIKKIPYFAYREFLPKDIIIQAKKCQSPN
jgi:ubiquinone/menaquinone biosynthesis C-methylase UbiE